MTNQTTQPSDDHHQYGATSRHRRTILWTATLALLLVGTGAQAQRQPSTPPAPPSETACGPFSFSRIERGTRALDHLQRLTNNDRKALAKAQRWLERRGFEPTNQAVVTTIESFLPTLPEHSSTDCLSSVASTTIPALVPGEALTWTWDDGDPSTWEGVLYIEDYDSGTSAIMVAQLGLDEVGIYPIQSKVIRLRGGAELALDRSSTTSSLLQPLADPYPLFWGFGDCALDEAQFYEDASTICVASAVGCIFSGSLWGLCTVGGCTAAMIGALLTNIDCS